jgi:spermidine synthase
MIRRPISQVDANVPYLPALLLLFVGSGCAALIYQIVWLQLLELVIGSSAISIGVLLGTFMGGMCLGSFALPRLVPSDAHPLRIYAYLELGIGGAAVLLLYGMPYVSQAYAVTGGGVIVRAAVAAFCLLTPTVLMGATLPAVARWVEASPAGVSWLGFFYGGNIAGAVAGTLLAGFYLLRVYDMAVATWVALTLNVGVAAIGLALAARTPHHAAPRTADPSSPHHRGSASRAVYVAIALSGFTALASEVLWTRLLALAVGATVYAFSLILAAFLFSLGVGSSLGAAFARRARDPRVALGWCQLLLCAAIAWAAYRLTEVLPLVPMPEASDPGVSLLGDFIRCLSVVVPGAVLWGASFPLALAAAAAPRQDTGRLVGGIYAANTAGAIAGALGAVFLAARIGSQHALQLLIVVSALSAAMLLVPRALQSTRVAMAAAALVVAMAGAALLAWRVVPVPGVLIAYGRNSASWNGVTKIEYAGEGLNAFVAVTRTPSGAPIYHAAGKVQASSEGEDMRLQRMLAHFSHLLPRRPRRVLVIGLGAGFTAGAVAIAPGVERMTIVEIEPLVPSLSPFFADYNYHVAANPKVEIRIDDARHYLLTSREQFDVITSDLVDPWVKGTAALFTREFFESMKAHLTPGGVVTMFVQLYMSNLQTVKSEVGTFVDVFPHTIVWGNTMEGQGYDLVLTGQAEPFAIDIDEMQARLDRPDHAEVAQSLREIGFASAVDLLSSYAGSREDLAPWLADAVINRDRNLRLQYFAGLGATLQQSGPIYAEMVRQAKSPRHLFRGSPAAMEQLTARIERAKARAATVSQR